MLFQSGMSVVYRNYQTTKLTVSIFNEHLGDKRFAHRKVSLVNSLLSWKFGMWWFHKRKSFRTIYFSTFLKYSLPMSVSKKTIEKIGHHPCLRGIIGWCYPIHASAVVANFPLVNYLAVYIEIPLPIIPYCVHSVAPTNHLTILIS